MNQISVVADIENAIQRNPDREAIETGNGVLTYRQFGAHADEFAARLRARTEPGEFIGIEAIRAAGSIVAMAGALKAGRPFVFVDPRDSESSNRAKVTALGVTLIARASDDAPLPTLAEPPAGWRSATGPAAGPIAWPDRLGYAIHTSGSTGEPKCVLVRADPLGRVIRDHVRRLAVGTGSRTLQFARLTFDGCVTEILWTLSAGACLVVLEEGRLSPGPVLASTLEQFRVTHVKTTPFALTATEPTSAMSLRHVINGGGACRPAVVRKWSAVADFHNAYGTTETTVCNFLSDALRPRDCAETVPLGELVGEGGYEIVPLPAGAGSPAGPGATRGELVLTGECVALGYLTERGLRPFTDDAGNRVYRTGDLVERREGRIFYVERLDRQLKVRGYRLDPGEVEGAACRLTGVVEAVVTAESHESTDGADALVCYYAGAATPREVRAHLESVLDSYKVPSVIQQIDELPYTPNGKVDHDALRAGRRAAVPASPAAAPADTVLELVRTLTGVGDAGLDDNFFDIGGDSASTVILLGQLRQLGWMDVGVRDVLRAVNLGELVVGLPGRGA
jgi:non-ribosomal peptide synthetase component F